MTQEPDLVRGLGNRARFHEGSNVLQFKDIVNILPSAEAPPWASLDNAMDNVCGYNWSKTLPSDLGRPLTSNEKHILPVILSRLMTHIQQKTDPHHIWFFDDCIGTVKVDYKPPPDFLLGRAYWRFNYPEGHWRHLPSHHNHLPRRNIYNFEKPPSGNTKYDIVYVVGTHRLGINLQTWDDVQQDIFLHFLYDVALKIRNTFIRLWCSVPHVKGMQFNTIVKQLSIQLLSKDQSASHILGDTLLSIKSDYNQEQKLRKQNAPTNKRKAIQRNAARSVIITENKLEYVLVKHSDKMSFEELELQRLQLRFDKQLAVIQTLKDKQAKEHFKIASELDNAYILRSSTLLSGVCVALNNHYKNTPDFKITENPFTHQSTNTFQIIECLISVPKTK